ncbi:hypothetical protein K2P56_03485 [Patescibacteria group bacterium]|nr:hypothetical protein [Patescibacteria group bacterium]
MAEGNGVGPGDVVFSRAIRGERPRLNGRAQNVRAANPDVVRKKAEGLAKVDRVFEIHVALRSAAEKLKAKIDAAEAGGGDADLQELVPDEKGRVDLSFLAADEKTGLVGISDGVYMAEAQERQTGKKKEIRDIDEVDGKVKSEILSSANAEYDEMVAQDAKFEKKARSPFGWVRQGAWENRKKLGLEREKAKLAESGEQFLDIVELGSFEALDEQLSRVGLRLNLHREGNVWKFEAQGIEEEQQFEMPVMLELDPVAALLANAELPASGPERDLALLKLGGEKARAALTEEAGRLALEEAEKRRITDMEDSIKALKARNDDLEVAIKEKDKALREADDRFHQHQRDVLIALLNKVGMDPSLADFPGARDSN